MTRALVPRWNGTDAELTALKHATEIHCRSLENQACDDKCAHRLLGNQRCLDGLLFMRRMRAVIEEREFERIT